MKPHLDKIDVRILASLQEHGQLSKFKLADMVNLSPSPCWVRLKKLQAAGYICGYHANIAYELVADVTQVCVTISLNHHRKEDFERFESYIQNIDEITECFATGGGMDYVLKIYTKSLQGFQNIIDSLLTAELGIDRYMTYIVTRKIKQTRPKLETLITPKSY